jgi:flavorubredoxin
MPLDLKKLFEEAAVKGVNLKGKVGATFGSYGWSGEAPKLVLEIMKNKFEMRIVEPPLLVKYAPDQNMLDMCRTLGKQVSESLIHVA